MTDTGRGEGKEGAVETVRKMIDGATVVIGVFQDMDEPFGGQGISAPQLSSGECPASSIVIVLSRTRIFALMC
jgi:hypothetical protein